MDVYIITDKEHLKKFDLRREQPKKFDLREDTKDYIRDYIFSNEFIYKAYLCYFVDTLIGNAESETLATIYDIMKERRK